MIFALIMGTETEHSFLKKNRVSSILLWFY
nr:MAG TPA: hypothetical protein [Caudoviricetes sp.]